MSSLKLHPSSGDSAIWLGYAGYASGSVVLPMVLVAMSGELGFDLASGGALHLVRCAVMMISMAMSAWLAGLWGKHCALGVSMMLISAGLAACSVSSAYWMLAGAIVLVGLGNGLFEGLATGYAQDLHIDDNPGRYINITHSFWPLGILLTVMGAGIYLEYGGSWRFLVLMPCVFLLVPALLFFYGSSQRHRPMSSGMPEHSAGTPLSSIRFLLFLCALFLAGGSEHCFTFWIPSLIELELSGKGIMCGVGVALFAAGMFVGRFLSGVLPFFKPSTLVVVCALFCSSVSLSIPRVESKNTLLLILPLLGIGTGPLWPSLQYCCASTLREYNSTRLYVLMPLFGIPGCGFFTWLLGLIGERAGLRAGFYMVFGCNLLIAILLMLLNKIQNARTKEK